MMHQMMMMGMSGIMGVPNGVAVVDMGGDDGIAATTTTSNTATFLRLLSK